MLREGAGMMSIIKLTWLQVPEDYFVAVQEFMFYLGMCLNMRPPSCFPFMISMYAMNLLFSL